MRWIACCLLAVGIGLGLSMTLIRHFASQPTDPNLAELGLSNNLDRLVAPDEPEPIPAAAQSASASLVPPEEIDLLASSPPLINKRSEPRVDSNMLPVSFIDTAGAAALDNAAHRWMPLCQELQDKCLQADEKKANRDTDHMPLCDEPGRLTAKPNSEKNP